MRNSIVWFFVIFGTYAVMATFGAMMMYVLYDICRDLYEMWEDRKR